MRYTTVLLAVFVLAFLLAGCGGTDTVATTVARSAPTTAVESAESATPEEQNEVQTSADVGTRENPVPIGQEVELCGWQIKVVKVDLDATAQDLMPHANPPTDRRNNRVLVSIAATRTGEGTARSAIYVNYQIVSGEGNTFEPPEHFDLPGRDQGERPSRELFSADLFFEVPSDQIEGVVIYMEEASTFGTDPVFFALK
jgi:hypothetical protein